LRTTPYDPARFAQPRLKVQEEQGVPDIHVDEPHGRVEAHARSPDNEVERLRIERVRQAVGHVTSPQVGEVVRQALARVCGEAHVERDACPFELVDVDDPRVEQFGHLAGARPTLAVEETRACPLKEFPPSGLARLCGWRIEHPVEYTGAHAAGSFLNSRRRSTMRRGFGVT
jgi:hypothetical protein